MESTTSIGTTERRATLALRLSVFQYSVTAIFVALTISFWIFQVPQHEKFEEFAENNHLRTLALRAPRGVLFDRNGRVLVANRYAFTVSLVREQTEDLDRSLRLFASIAGVDEKAVRETVYRHRHEPKYRPIVLIEDASLAQIASVAAHKLELPDIVVERVPTRRYPDDEFAAHVFGYMGEVTEAQLARTEQPKLRMGAVVGQSGVEKTYNAILMGQDGARRVVVNSIGREIRTVGEVEAVEGRRMQLTIDYDLQRAAEDAFKAAGYSGASVILDPQTGEVLSYVSLPAYDPNAFVAGVDRATWESLNGDKLTPLQNRAIQGRYSPGSIFKLVVATAALEESIATPDFKVQCNGGAYFYGRYFQCHLKRGHGTLDMRHAIEQSCNVYFYTLGNMIGIDRLHKWATALGLGEMSGIDLPNEVQGLMPSTAWKKARTGEKWYAGETISVSIGQGPVWVTPVSLAVMISTLANGSRRIMPHLLRAVDVGDGWKRVPPPPTVSMAGLKPETVEVLHDGLWLVVNGAGTGGRGRIAGRDVAGKTGTAQVISLEGAKQAAQQTDVDLRDHGWFVFFAPRDNPEIAGVVFAEHAEHGYLAAPIARHVIETYFAKKEDRPLPMLEIPHARVADAAEIDP